MARYRSYVVRRDFGFAPNPFWGVLTLATCKPTIRRVQREGEIVLGVGGKTRGLEGRLIFIGRVSRTMSFQQYWDAPEFVRKRPNLSGSRKAWFGDNIYHKDEAGDWIQEDSHHSLEGGAVNQDNLNRDTSTDRVLVCDEFSYFGSNHIPIPENLLGSGDQSIQPARYDRTRFSPEFETQIDDWVVNVVGFNGYLGDPIDFRSETIPR